MLFWLVVVSLFVGKIVSKKKNRLIIRVKNKKMGLLFVIIVFVWILYFSVDIIEKICV